MVVIGASPASPTILVCLKQERFLKCFNYLLDASKSLKFESFSSSGYIPAWQHLRYHSYNTSFMLPYFAIFFIDAKSHGFTVKLTDLKIGKALTMD